MYIGTNRKRINETPELITLFYSLLIYIGLLRKKWPTSRRQSKAVVVMLAPSQLR